MRNIHDEIGRKCSKAVKGEGEHLAHGIKADFSDIFQPNLWDLTEGACIAGSAVYRFAVTEPLGQGSAFLDAAHNGKRDVRLKRKELAARVVKGEDVFSLQKTAVFGVKVIFLKPAHAEFAVSVLFIQCAQLQYGEFAAFARGRCVHAALLIQTVCTSIAYIAALVK